MTDDVVLDIPSTEEKAQHYKAMGDSVDLIYAVMSGDTMADETDEEKKDCVKRNVEHVRHRHSCGEKQQRHDMKRAEVVSVFETAEKIRL